MKRVIAGVVAVALTVGSGAASAAGRQDKTARGVVSAIGADSVTVKVNDQDTKFVVDTKTVVTVRGGGTAQRSAEAEGRAGAQFGSLVKTGQTVEVKYSEAGMHASSLRVLPAGAAAPDSGKSAPAKPAVMTTAGVVTAMTGSSLTLKAAAGDTTFVVDDKTVVVGTGLGTKARETAAAGKKQGLADVVAVGDSVSVTWHDMAGARHAASVRVRTKGAAKS